MMEEIFGKHIMERGEAFAKRMLKKLDILRLIEANIECYKDFYRENKIKHIAVCKITHRKYLEEAKKQELDISDYPEELNYLEIRN